jgi:hypothetical protein
MPRPAKNAKLANQLVLSNLSPRSFNQQKSHLFTGFQGSFVAFVSPLLSFLDLVEWFKSELYFCQHRRKPWKAWALVPSRLQHYYAWLLSRFTGRTAMTLRCPSWSTPRMRLTWTFRSDIIERPGMATVPTPAFMIPGATVHIPGAVGMVAPITEAPGLTFVATALCTEQGRIAKEKFHTSCRASGFLQKIRLPAWNVDLFELLSPLVFSVRSRPQRLWRVIACRVQIPSD